MPTLNEAKNITKIVPAIFDQQQNLPNYILHVLLVDGDSQDGTKDIALKLKNSYPHLDIITCKERGLGRAYKEGFKHTIKVLDPDFIFEMDADGQHEPKMIPTFLNLASNGTDCVIGSRFVAGGKLINFSFKRKLMSKVGNLLIRIVGGIPGIADCTSGYRCIKTSFIKKCQFKYLLTTGYAFQSSLISELVRHKARIIEYPITFNERKHGESKLRLSDQIDFLINLFFIRINKSFQFIKYILVGLLGLVVNMGCYYVLTRFYGFQQNIAYLLAIELSVINNFIFHHLWTFKSPRIKKRPIQHRFITYHLSVLASIFVQYTVFLICYHLLSWWDMLATFIGICAGFFINYIINTQITWKTKVQSKLT
tara:strand:+ start:17 stop:1117 length:1101 start_codon:yes stop_codon:yes gene_type:complete